MFWTLLPEDGCRLPNYVVMLIACIYVWTTVYVQIMLKTCLRKKLWFNSQPVKEILFLSKESGKLQGQRNLSVCPRDDLNKL
jgi:hypothetical protein